MNLFRLSIVNVSYSSFYVFFVWLIFAAIAQISTTVSTPLEEVFRGIATALAIITFLLCFIYIMGSFVVTYRDALDKKHHRYSIITMSRSTLLWNLVNLFFTNNLVNGLILHMMFLYGPSYFGRINGITTVNQLRNIPVFMLAAISASTGYGITHIEIVPTNDTWFIELFYIYMIVIAYMITGLLIFKLFSTTNASVDDDIEDPKEAIKNQ